MGSHMADLLVSKGQIVIGLSRGGYGNDNIKHLKGKIKLQKSDITNNKDLFDIVKRTKPDYIFHFAAQSSNLDSFEEPKQTFEMNLLGTLNLLEAVVRNKLDSSIIIAGSSEEYGKVEKSELPISEENPLRPQNPYAVSKIAASYLSYQYAKTYNLRLIRTRSFNQEGPRRQERYVISSFAKQIVEIENGLKVPVIEVGNLEAERDFLDVRDAVRAYWMLSMKGEVGEVYNICSMKPRRVKDILDALLVLSLKNNIRVNIDPKRMRPSEVPLFYGNNGKARSLTGWIPKISFKKTLMDTLNYWRETLGQ